MIIKLQRLFDEPILRGNLEHEWEQASCYNAGAIEEKGVIHLFYRATDSSTNGRENTGYMNYIGHGTSLDGINFQRDDNYVLGPVPDSQEQRGCEDPRIVKIDDTFYMTYTGYGARFPGDYRLCLATSNNLKDWVRKGSLLDETNKDGALFPDKFGDDYLLLHRRSPNIWVSYSKDLNHWDRHKVLAEIDTDSPWEDCKIGIAGPPIKTDQGYILIYHGVSESETTFNHRGAYKQYALGIMLLDLDDPTKILYRQKAPILVPELSWEREEGYVPNVVFSCGQIIKDNQLYVYYAGADKALGIATCQMDDVMGLFDEVKQVIE